MLKLLRRPVVDYQAGAQVARLPPADRREMNLRVRAQDGHKVPGRDGYTLTLFGCSRFRVLWRLRDAHTPVIMAVVETGEYD